MAHYAKLDNNNFVVEVVVVSNDVITINGIEDEQAGIDFLRDLLGHEHWKQTSYNATIRKNYAGIGYKYDAVLDAFIPPKPGGNYILNENTCLWVKAPEIGITDGDPIIAADGVDFVTVYIAGGAANSTEVVMVNNELLDISTDADGYGEFEVSSETTVLLVIAWNNISLEVAAI